MKFFADIKEDKVKFFNSLSLAFVGDAVFTLYAREKVANLTDTSAGQLHIQATRIVCAKSQALLAEKMLPLLTEEETGVFRRAKNSKHMTAAKNANPEEYANATGVEAVIGYLYLSGKNDRIKELLEKTGA